MLFCSTIICCSLGMRNKEDTSLSLGQVALVLVFMRERNFTLIHTDHLSLSTLIFCKFCPRMVHQSGDTTASRSTGADPAVTCTCAPCIRQSYPDD